MDARLLIVDDDPMLVEMTRSSFEEAGYRVDTAGNGMEGLHKLMEWDPDLVVLDLVMPRLDGWETCRRIREISSVPIIMLTGVVGADNELKGLYEGADIYMTKPFSIPILIARVDALLRRTQGTLAHPTKQVANVGDLQINLAERAATMYGQPLDLSRTEYRLLVTLAVSPGRVIPNEELIRQVWGDCQIGDQEQYLKLYIHYLRRKIEEDPAQPRYIRNRRGIGYMLACP
jgi:DNA-binding response OmpR family regulator